MSLVDALAMENCRISRRRLSYALKFVILFSISSLSVASQCKDTTETFTFLAKWNLTHGIYLIVHEYEPVTIDCSTNVCNASVSLMVQGISIGQSTLFNGTLKRTGSIFQFVARMEQDSSRIWCQAKANDKQITSQRGEMIIKRGRSVEPVTLIPDVNDVTLEEGDSFEVKCEALGHGTRDVSYLKWYKQNTTGKYLLDKPFVVRKSILGQDIEVLTIRNATYGVQGIYKCERNVGIGPGTAASFNVIYKVPEKPIVNVTSRSQKLKEQHGSTSITCVSYVGSPRPSLAWYKDGIRRKACFKQTNCTLLIKHPKYPDDNGNFTCTATNSKGSHSSYTSIQILVAPVIAKSESFGIKLAKVADANHNAELKCTTKRSNPLPTFTWFHLVGNKWLENFDKINVFPNISVPTNTSILILPPSKGTAVFRCRASNEAGNDARNVTVHWKADSLVSDSEQQRALVAVISCCMILILLVLALTYFYKRRLFKRYGLYLQPNLHFEFDSTLALQEQAHKMPYDPKWEFPKDKVFMLEPIGKGAFGEVWLAKAQGILEFKAEASSMSPTKKKRFSRMFSTYSNYNNVEMMKNTELTKVAVKTLKDDATASEFKDLASELKILIHIGEHQNIVNLLGACTQSGRLCVILEYCPYGDLSSFLRDKRDIFEASWGRKEDEFISVCTYYDLANFTYQIARGMDFLASKKCVHRDLAARNILVSKDYNDAYVVKVADFGMSRDIYKDGVYVKQSSGVLPLKWTAPESIADAIYTSQSDVWSFGVVLWEIFTLGGSPYPGISTDEFLSFLKSKRKMDQPDSCPDEFYKLMLDCWEDEPEMRPIFAKIYERIGNLIEEFADVNATYLRLDGASSLANKRHTNAYINSSADDSKGIESAETIEVSFKSFESSNGSREIGYQNLVKFETLNGKDQEEEQPAEYVEMLSNAKSDENENVLHSKRTHPLL